LSLEWEATVLIAALLVSARLGALFMFSPLFMSASVPGTVRALFALGLAAGLVASLRYVPAELPFTVGAIIRAIVLEVFVGATMAFGLFSAFGAFLVGGRVLDFQMGFSVANVVDPSTSAQAPLVGTALNMMAIATFFLLDGHRLLLRGIAYSLEKIPIGQGFQNLHIEAVVAQFGLMFVFGLAAVAPAVITLLLMDTAMAVAARTMPQVNVFILSLPLKIFIGLSVMAITLPSLGPLLERVYESIFRYWERIAV
jgi:flagellar biosynthetic protein FliR